MCQKQRLAAFVYTQIGNLRWTGDHMHPDWGLPAPVPGLGMNSQPRYVP